MNFIKTAVIGCNGVGKSSLTIQLVQNLFRSQFNPTIEDVYDKKVVIDEETFWIEIFDTVAEDDYYDPRHPHLREVEGFLIVYAINSRKSFSKVSSFRKQIQITKNAVKVPMIIVGNKNDLENERQVSQCEGKDLATSFDYPFIETSAKTRSNVEEAFCDLVREIRMFKFETQQDNNTAIKKEKQRVFSNVKRRQPHTILKESSLILCVN